VNIVRYRMRDSAEPRVGLYDGDGVAELAGVRSLAELWASPLDDLRE
jgi:2-dehydro-3-deoxy-D-arabinonate dehydratase